VSHAAKFVAAKSVAAEFALAARLPVHRHAAKPPSAANQQLAANSQKVKASSSDSNPIDPSKLLYNKNKRPVFDEMSRLIFS
jgi:hypothetical protein